MSEDIGRKVGKVAQQLDLSKVHRADLMKLLQPFHKSAISNAVDIWFAKNLGPQGYGYKYFVGIVRGCANELKANTKLAGKSPPMME